MEREHATDLEKAKDDSTQIAAADAETDNIETNHSTDLGKANTKDNEIAAAHQWPIQMKHCLLYTSPSPRDLSTSRMPSSA